MCVFLGDNGGRRGGESDTLTRERLEMHHVLHRCPELRLIPRKQHVTSAIDKVGHVDIVLLQNVLVCLDHVGCTTQKPMD